MKELIHKRGGSVLRLKNRRWVHYEIASGESLCGKRDFKIRARKNKNKVTCRRCLREMEII